jgi:hypothetical protein
MELFNEYISACSIRVARDIMALLPVMQVRVCTMLEKDKILDVEFDKGMLSELNYKGKVRELIGSGKYKYKYCYGSYAASADAKQDLAEVRKIFKDAYVVRYKGLEIVK